MTNGNNIIYRMSKERSGEYAYNIDRGDRRAWWPGLTSFEARCGDGWGEVKQKATRVVRVPMQLTNIQEANEEYYTN